LWSRQDSALSGSRATNLHIQVALKTATSLIAPDRFNNWWNPMAISAHAGYFRNKC
jgi:hypothetical protein